MRCRLPAKYTYRDTTIDSVVIEVDLDTVVLSTRQYFEVGDLLRIVLTFPLTKAEFWGMVRKTDRDGSITLSYEEISTESIQTIRAYLRGGSTYVSS